MDSKADRNLRAKLNHMHWEQKQSLHFIARSLNISMRTLVRLMIRLGVPRRSYVEATKLQSKTSWITGALLNDLYWRERLSLSQIGAKLGMHHTSILELMNRFSIPRRTTSQAGMRYEKHPFSGDPNEASYLLGFRAGDLHAAMYGYQVRLSTSSTHPAMSRLFGTLFGNYGRVGRSPALHKRTYQWLNYCYLDSSFRFLIEKPRSIPNDFLSNERKFLAFFAGYADAESNLRIYQEGRVGAYSFRINSEDELILRQSSRALRRMGYHTYCALSAVPSSSNDYRRDVWSFGMFRKVEILDLLRTLDLRHDEKVRWRELMITAAGEDWNRAKPKIVELKSSIKREVQDYSLLAESSYRGTHT